MATREEMYSAVEQYVSRERDRRGVRELGDQPRMEPSGDGNGEYRLLIDVQLIPTRNGLGGWSQLNDLSVLTGVYEEVLLRTRAQGMAADDT